MSFGERLRARIAEKGPLPLATYMAACNAHYYETRDPFGPAGDFVTAPEISQMFGELVGLALADLWVRAGRPEPVRYVELGPGRGTLAADALRAMARAGLTPAVEFVETSPTLRAAQAERVRDARWHDDLSTLPADEPLLTVANEFFDALPVRQIVRTEAGWRERMVAATSDGRLAWMPGDEDHADDVPLPLAAEPVGTVVEVAPAAATLMHDLAGRIGRQGGVLLAVDYGHLGPLPGDTLQAVRAHGWRDPLEAPGEQDLTAHVDFASLAAAAAPLAVHGPVPQGIWLDRLGITARAAALRHANPGQAAAIEAALARLTRPDAMGVIFKATAFVHPDWPVPAGFG